jgi:hypothetical protein
MEFIKQKGFIRKFYLQEWAMTTSGFKPAILVKGKLKKS